MSQQSSLKSENLEGLADMPQFQNNPTTLLPDLIKTDEKTIISEKGPR